MREIRSVLPLRDTISNWRSNGARIAFVPTMGNLHDGHLKLVERARRSADHVVASIFVNPLQFDDGEDYSAYPRTLEHDRNELINCDVDALFLPNQGELYGKDVNATTRVEVPGLSTILCGAFRPGHFVGVTTVVAKLFNMVQPDVAVFGEKDFQQLLVIRRMVADLKFPVEIEAVPTVREPDGVAMSSRNQYLSAEERAQAPKLFHVLERVCACIVDNEGDFHSLQNEAMAELVQHGFRPEYFEIRTVTDLSPARLGDQRLVVLAAAWLGAARLIDNLQVSL